MSKNLLLLSNSTLIGEPYFAWPLPYYKAFVEKHNITDIAFVPFAAVTFSFEEYTRIFQEAVASLGVQVHNVAQNPEALNTASAIAVGGGNTFALLKRSYESGAVEIIQRRVAEGTPYSGWSAGANLSCPMLCTTNDMPIVEPPSFKALNLIPFQINPHYTDRTLDGHGGESRDTRIKEYIELNQDMFVAGIPEGALIELENGAISYKGSGALKVFKYGKEPQLFQPGDNISLLLNQ